MKKKNPIRQFIKHQALKQDHHRWLETYRTHLTGWPIFCDLMLKMHSISMNSIGDDRNTHSVHTYFFPKQMKVINQVEYELAEIRDGRTFDTRDGKALINKDPVLTMLSSYHTTEKGPKHQIALSDQPNLKDANIEKNIYLPNYFTRTTEPENTSDTPCLSIRSHNHFKADLKTACWTRWEGNLPEEAQFHQCIFSAMTTYLALDLGEDSTIKEPPISSISIWLHAGIPIKQWLLWISEGSKQDALRRTSVYTEDGTIVASVATQNKL